MGNLPWVLLGVCTGRFFWGDKSDRSGFKSVSAESGSCGIGSCKAESKLHGTAPVQSFPVRCFVQSVCKK
jgi:hypothetical protein